ncbi:MAG: ParB/RepB/Spo0J family partition protein [Anaerolineales bacterium]|nr:ParB/RepB/Spo0J family partition protein [Anaerolineales bacterium]MBX3006163.1 ParB/RepB/Spo0J family partition protein [Anaerolineales bacterium]
MKKSRLGRGLDSLIPSESAIKPSDVQQVAVEAIRPNPHQPRTHFAKEQLAELAESIRTYGVIQPLIVKEDAGGRYTLIAGERRLQASKLAGLATVPVVSREASDRDLVELALVENVQRADLSPLETAEAYQHMHHQFNLSHDEIARRVGKSRVAITNTLGLLELSAAVKQALLDESISEGHARALKALDTPQAQRAALSTIVSQGLNVRQTEELVRKLRGTRPKAAAKASQSAEIRDLQNELRDALGTKVKVQHSRKGGHITVFYYSDEELDSLVTRLTKRR